MLFAYQKLVYRIPQDIIHDALGQDELNEIEMKIVETKARRYREISEDCITEDEFNIRVAEESISGEVGTHIADVVSKAFEYIRANHDISKWAIDIPASAMGRNLHGEPGQGFDVDNHTMVTCEDCKIESMEYMEDIKRYKVLNKAEIVPTGNDLSFMIRFALREAGIDLSTMGEEQPEFRLFMRKHDGEAMELSLDDIAGILANEQESVPQPTHVGNRRLN